MNEENVKNNATHLLNDLTWLESIIINRLHEEFPQFEKILPVRNVSFPKDPPAFDGNESPYWQMLQKYSVTTEERILLLIALAPQLRPELLDHLIIKNPIINKVYTRVGGQIPKSGRIFLPTIETFYFIVAGDDIGMRLRLSKLIAPDHWLTAQHLISISQNDPLELYTSGVLNITRQTLEMITTGEPYAPRFGADFPAKKITTKLNWSDLVLRNTTRMQVEELRNWLKYRSVLDQQFGMNGKLKPGFKALFYGSPGTGKTMTASLLGKELNKDVYRIDLSMVVSKYIGETEKNLAKVFDMAERADWILFFDEADALFGKRTTTESSNDRYANQEVSYLLQRVEDFPGMVILASNFKSNIDHAFIRRFNSIVFFPLPKSDERLLIWKTTLPKNLKLAADLDLEKVAEKYELSGAHVMNIMNHSLIKMLADNKTELDSAAIHASVIRELSKEGRTI